MIKNFISRNKSVFGLGLLTFLVFITIITISEIRRIQGNTIKPNLKKLEETEYISETENTGGLQTDKEDSNESAYDSSAEEIIVDEAFWENPESTQSILAYLSENEIDKKYGIMRIDYTDNGFSPKNSKAVIGQKVRWINNTNEDIYIKQKTLLFKEFKEPVLLPANGMYEFRLNRSGMWSYEETTNKRFGSIIIIKP